MECQNCTYLNEANSRNCEICNNKIKPQKERREQKEMRFKVCPICSFHNPVDIPYCGICNYNMSVVAPHEIPLFLSEIDSDAPINDTDAIEEEIDFWTTDLTPPEQEVAFKNLTTFRKPIPIDILKPQGPKLKPQGPKLKFPNKAIDKSYATFFEKLQIYDNLDLKKNIAFDTVKANWFNDSHVEDDLLVVLEPLLKNYSSTQSIKTNGEISTVFLLQIDHKLVDQIVNFSELLLYEDAAAGTPYFLMLAKVRVYWIVRNDMKKNIAVNFYQNDSDMMQKCLSNRVLPPWPGPGELCSFVTYIASSKSRSGAGHYILYVKHNYEWFKINDQSKYKVKAIKSIDNLIARLAIQQSVVCVAYSSNASFRFKNDIPVPFVNAGVNCFQNCAYLMWLHLPIASSDACSAYYYSSSREPQAMCQCEEKCKREDCSRNAVKDSQYGNMCLKHYTETLQHLKD